MTSRQDALTDWFAAMLPAARDIRVEGIGAASSGVSSDTSLFTLRYEDGGTSRAERLVLRTAPDGRRLFPDYDLGLQADVMRALARASIPVPVVRWYEGDPAIIGSPFLIMDHIDGDTPSDTPPGFHGAGLFFDADETQRRAMWNAGIAELVRLHAIDWTTLGLSRLTGATPDRDACRASHVAVYENWLAYSGVVPSPTLRRGLDWMRETPMPQDQPLIMLWGDGRPGNILYRHGRPAALLDWEIASIGLAGFDLGYFIWSAEVLREANNLPRLPGLPTREETIAEYMALCSRPFDFAYGELFALVRLAVMNCMGAGQAGDDPYFKRFIEQNAVIRAIDERL